MLVYRCLTSTETTNMYKESQENGAFFKAKNTHQYQEGKSYIHFFPYSQFAEYYSKSFNAQEELGHCGCMGYMVADIPNSILNKYFGYGFYDYEDENFKRLTIPIPEYAMIEVILIKIILLKLIMRFMIIIKLVLLNTMHI